MNYKRRKSRNNVRCWGCTDGRMNIGGDRQRENRSWKEEVQEFLSKSKIHNGVEQSGSSSVS